MKYNALIIGCGSIGTSKEYRFDSPDSKNILTHAHGCYTHEKINLVGVMDSDIEKARRAADKWDTTWVRWVKDEHASDTPIINIDIVVIATPTETHLEVIEKVKSELKPKVIILEKPCGMDSTEAQAIKEIAGDTPIAVNYIRRYDPMIQAVQRELSGKKIFSANVKYGRGLVRDGSHGIDFMNWFFGECQDFQILDCKIYNDYSMNDLTCSAYGEWENCPSVSFQAIDGRVCDVFEIEIMSELGCHWFLNHGNDIYFRRIEDERMYGNYKALSSSVNVTRTSLGTDLLMLYDNVIANIEGREKLLCTIGDAIAVHKVIEGGRA